MRSTEGSPPDLTPAELLAAIPDAMLMVDADWRITHVNGHAAELLARSAAELVGLQLWAAFPTAIGTIFHTEPQRAVAEGTTRRFTAFFDPIGAWLAVRVVPMAGGVAVFFTDVTEYKRAELRAASFADVQAVLRRVATAVAAEAAPDAVHRVVCRETARLLGAHSAWLVRFERPQAFRVLGVHAAGGMPPVEFGEDYGILPGSELEHVLQTGLPVAVADEAAGRFAHAALPAALVAPIRQDGSVWGAIAVGWDHPRPDVGEAQPWLVDLAELVSLALGNAEARAELARRSTSDPMTGVANLRALEEALDRAVSRGRRHDHPLTLALVEVEGLGAVIAGSGHVVGDRVLSAVAGQLGEVVRTEDLVARTDGHGFAVLLDGGDAPAAYAALDRVRASIGSVLARQDLPEVTLAAGLCEWEPGMSREGLLDRAGDALRWACGTGRDGAWVHDRELVDVPEGAREPGESQRAGAGEVVSAGDLQRRLRSARAFWQSTVDALPERIAVLTETGEIVAVNQAWRRDGELLPCVGGDVFDSPMDPATATALRDVLTGTRQQAEVERPFGGRWWRMRADRFAGDPRRVVVHHEDITDRRRAERDARFRGRLLDEVDAAVIATDMEGTVRAWNRAAARMFGWDAADAVGRPLDELVHVSDAGAVRELRNRVLTEGSADAELVVHRRSGETLPIYTRQALLRGRDGRPATHVAVSIDITERHRYQRDLESARDYLGAVTSSMADGLLVVAQDGRIALANAAAAHLLGHAPDALPGEPAEPLLFGREGGLLAGDGPAGADDDEFLRADGTRMPVSWRRSPLGAGDGQHVIVFHDVSERRAREHRLRLEAEGLRWAARIRRALDEDRFELYAQPICDVATGTVVHHELLLRLHDEHGGLITPAHFLPAAEEHELMADLDTWVLRRAVEFAARGRSVHVNLSARSVGDPAVLSALGEAIEDAQVDPSRIVIEVTETALMRPGADATGFLRWVREIGCGIALDDFGTGYSGLERVTQAPVDAIKIDISFVRGLLDDPVKESVVRAMVSLARDIGATCVAEGVEDAATLERLGEMGVQQAQGFLLGAPAPFDP